MLEGLDEASRSRSLLIRMLSWAMLGHLGIILRQHSDKMRQSWDQDEVQDRQDVPARSARGPLEGGAPSASTEAGDPKRSHLPSPHPSPTLQPRAYEMHQDAGKVLALSGIYVYVYTYIYVYTYAYICICIYLYV